jgi:hypothetical protein
MFWYRWLEYKMFLNSVTSCVFRNRPGLNVVANVPALIFRTPCFSTRMHKWRATGNPCDYILEGGAHILGSCVWSLFHVTLPAFREFGWLLDFVNFVLCCTTNFRPCFKSGQVCVSEWKEQGLLNTSAVVDCTKYGDAHLPYKAITHSSRSERPRKRLSWELGLSQSHLFSVYVCICVNLSFFPSMVCCKYQLVEFLPIIPRTQVHSRPAIYDPALDFHRLVFLLLFAKCWFHRMVTVLKKTTPRNSRHKMGKGREFGG